MTGRRTTTRFCRSARTRSPRRSIVSIGCWRSAFIPTTRKAATRTGSTRSTRRTPILSDPERRAKYDVSYHQIRQDRWRLVSSGANAENDFEIEQIGRLTLLEALYTRRRMEPTAPSLMTTDLETLIGRPREHLEFTIWYLPQKKYVMRDDQARLQITADGVEHLEQNYRSNLQRRRLQAPSETTD